MISLSAAVNVILILLAAAMIFGLLWWLINLVGALFASEVSQMFIKVARVVLAILAVLFLIGLVISFINHEPLFRP